MAATYTPTVLMQAGTQGGQNNFTANFQHNGLFYWRLLEDTPIGTGGILVNGFQARQLSGTTGAEFSRALGINFFTSASPDDSDAVAALYWRHDFPGNVLTLRVGQDEVAAIDDGCRYACDDTASFLATPLSSSPVRSLPGSGLSLIANLSLSPIVGVEVGAGDANGDGQLNLGRPFHTSELAYAVALKFTDPFKSIGDGLYKFSIYHVDPTKQGTPSALGASRGFSIQVDQDVGDVGLFAKYSATSGSTGLARRFASGGTVWKRPFGHDEDWLGVGFGWVDSLAPDMSDGYVLETYYRMQLTPLVQITADAMLVMDPATRSGDGVSGVFSFRSTAQF